ncbi:MAG: VCBS repeat-containing protein, partial [Planctomycetes bacterium]|nr:VCBS repeat-containing protein [Planctomycetota bacterium]
MEGIDRPAFMLQVDRPAFMLQGPGRMRVGAALLLVSVLVRDRAEAQLFESLNAFADRLDSGDPAVPATGFYEGPKGIAAADIDGDGDPDLVASNLDGTVTVYKRSMTAQDFSPPVHLPTFLPTLRGIILEDLTSDGRPEILAAA